MLEVREIRGYWRSEVEGYYCKGHVDAAAFSEAVQKEYDAEPLPLACIEHVYARYAYDFAEDYPIVLIPVNRKRGAFAATYYEQV